MPRAAKIKQFSHLRGSAVVLFALLLLGAMLSPITSVAQDVQFFRIGTGSSSGTYLPIGGILASAISNPPGSRACDRGGSCGVPGLIAVAQSTEGSVDNVTAIAAGNLESGFSQADVSYWAQQGKGIFSKGAIPNLRAIANLFPESVHLVVRRDSGIRSVEDLRGKRISIDREGSGTRVDALLILKAYGLGIKDIKAYAVASGTAADMLREGKLDGFFMVVGTPATAVVNLAEDSQVTLVPISGPKAEKLRQAYPFFAADRIEAGTYFNIPETETLSVGAEWLVSAALPDDLVYQITRALWHDNTRRLLDQGHPKGKLITLKTALNGLAVPLHPGAERYYKEIGLIK